MAPDAPRITSDLQPGLSKLEATENALEAASASSWRFRDQVRADFLGASAQFMPRDCGRILTAEFDYGGADWTSADADTSWQVLPVACVEYPGLLSNVRIEWDITGDYVKSGAGMQQFDWELMVDGVASGAEFSWSSSVAVAPGGIMLFSAVLRVVGNVGGVHIYDLEARMVVRNEAHVTVFDVTKAVRPILDGVSARQLGFRVRKAVPIIGDKLAIHSIGATQPLYRSGH